MELRHLRYFVAVAETGSIAAASRRLYIAQPPLSRQLQDLEREVGVALFVRHARGMTLTAAGREFLAHANALLSAAAAAIEHARHASHADALRVALPEFGRSRALALEAVALVREAHPDATLTLESRSSHEQIVDVCTEQVDVGFSVAAPDVAAGRETGLVGELLLAEPTTHITVPRGHVLASATVLEPADLSRVAGLSYPHRQQPVLVPRWIDWLQARGWRERRFVTVEHAAVMVDMVAHLDAWLPSPATFAPFLPSTLVARPLAGADVPGQQPPSGDVHVITRPGIEDDNVLAGAFLDELRAARARWLARREAGDEGVRLAAAG